MFLGVGVSVALAAAIGLDDFDQPALRIVAVLGEGAGCVRALRQAPAGFFVLAAAFEACGQLHAADAALAVAAQARGAPQRVGAGHQASGAIVFVAHVAAIGSFMQHQPLQARLAFEVVTFHAAQAVGHAREPPQLAFG